MIGCMNHAVAQAARVAEGQAQLARLLKVAPSTVNQWISGKRPVPIERCVAIERLTRGVVARQDLRPDDWREIWPEIAALTAAPSQAPELAQEAA